MAALSEANGIKVAHGTEKPELTVYVKYFTPTSFQNAIKPLTLLNELEVPYNVQGLQDVNEAWFAAKNPYRLVPAVGDSCRESGGEPFSLFDSSALLLYIAERYDTNGRFGGCGWPEKAVVWSWLCSYAAGFGGAAKIWHTFELRIDAGDDPAGYAAAMRCLEERMRDEYALLEKRLQQPGQTYIALGDRPTLPDYAYWPFTNRKIAATAGISFDTFPKLEAWSERMQARPAAQKAWEQLQQIT